MESIPGEDAMKTVEMATKDLEDYINFIDKVVVWKDWLQFWKMFYYGWNAIKQHHMQQRNHSWKDEPIDLAHFIAVLF